MAVAMGAPEYRVVVTEAPGGADFAVLYRALDAFYAPISGEAAVRPLAVLLRDPAGATIGGLWGRTVYCWLAIEMLFVPETLRQRGVGARLFADAEREARGRSCIGATVDTFDMRARRFYERLGFSVNGVQDDLPPGHTLFHLGKKFSSTPGAKSMIGAS